MRSEGERAGDVRPLLAAARRVVAERAAIVPDIARATGLSPEGVELALTRHLEVDATDEELRALVRRAGDSPRTLVILSANVFVAALRAIALARAASERVVVRPSRREPIFARALVTAARCPEIAVDQDADPADFPEVHVYGRDETIARVQARAGHARVRGHGAGMGAAWIGAGDDLDAAAEALASDVVPFDQRGCLSPRVALVAGDDSRALRFGQALHEALARWAARVPRGVVAEEDLAAAARYAATVAYAGEVHEAPDHVVGVARAGGTLLVPPACRCVHVASAGPTPAALLAPVARHLAAFGANDAREAARIAPPHARLSPLGRMQTPPLDGPVDLRPGA